MEFIFDSPLGKLVLGFSGTTLTALHSITYAEAEIASVTKGWASVDKICDWLTDYFDGKNPPVQDLNIRASGTAFQERVWKLLMDLPYGYCVTYAFLASLLQAGRKGKLLARAVGNALASNPIWIIIPCHRVIRADGELGKYAGGEAMKKALLLLEGVDLPLSCLKRKINAAGL